MDLLGARNRHLLGWMGTVCLLLILPVKLLRFFAGADLNLIIGIAPSILGPPGLLFLLLSSTGRLSRLTPSQITLVVATIAVGLELIQLVPRPAVLARVHYTFDYLDLVASLVSLLVAYFVVRRMTAKQELTPRRQGEGQA